MNSRTVITVDGLAASGKSTLARLLAEKLGFVHLNTGLLYRSVALLTIRCKVDPHDEAKVRQLLADHTISLQLDEKKSSRAFIDGADVTENLHAPHVSEKVSIVAQQRAVREALFAAQRDAFPGSPMVAEGRDMGTVVFKDAPLKFFVVADESVRVERRVRQLLAHTPGSSQSDELQLRQKTTDEIRERDKLDAARALAPMLAAADSVPVDNSSNSLDKTLGSMLAIVAERALVN